MDDLLTKQPAEVAISVSQLNRRARSLLEQGIAKLWVEGEISNIARPASGHVYFSLKDDSAQIRAAFFRQRQRGPTLNLKNGDLVLVFGRVSLYEARGDYQLIVEQIEPAGEGALKREFDRLKKKLAAEGLFDEARKQPLPALPARIGIVTSPSGAAVRDVLTVLKRRFPAVPAIVYPAAVQGEAAPGELIAALERAADRDECDVLIVGRGGGSLEDLWAFNDEGLARAIADCPIPIVSAVGHEVDVTIADFVADLRAPTPTAAAELVVPDSTEWSERLTGLASRLARASQRSLETRGQSLDYLSRRLMTLSPESTLKRQHAALREQTARLITSIRQTIYQRRHDVQTLRNALLAHSPAVRVERSISRLDALLGRMSVAAHGAVGSRRHRLELAMRELHAVSPLATLERGYAIVLDTDSGKALTDANESAVGRKVRAKLLKGSLLATVESVDEDDEST